MINMKKNFIYAQKTNLILDIWSKKMINILLIFSKSIQMITNKKKI